MALQCRDGFGAMRWPDGRGLLDQPVKMIRAFDVIYSASEKFRPKEKP